MKLAYLHTGQNPSIIYGEKTWKCIVGQKEITIYSIVNVHVIDQFLKSLFELFSVLSLAFFGYFLSL